MATITFDERKTNERPGVRAQHRHARFSAYKAREVLDLIRGKSVGEARTILAVLRPRGRRGHRQGARLGRRQRRQQQRHPAEELFVAACYADEGPTMKRWRPRARGRATRIRKRTCHITVIVGRYSPDRARPHPRAPGRQGPHRADASAARARRVARSRSGAAEAPTDAPTVDEDATAAEADGGRTDEAATTAVVDRGSADDAEARIGRAPVDDEAHRGRGTPRPPPTRPPPRRSPSEADAETDKKDD